METHSDPLKYPPSPDSMPSESGDLGIRSKSSMRIRYEAEVEVLKRKIGDLEAIREQLGLSQRKMCQLLMVDPSAWTRWARGSGQAPPHIFRALQWYLALQEKYPALDVNFWLSAAPRAQGSLVQDEVWRTTNLELESLKREVEALRSELKSAHQNQQIRQRNRWQVKSLFFALAFGLMLGWLIKSFSV
ncbi:MAG: hypothetical protein NDI61_03275 [Bdellovibrionaceae bacterium]|nr:hypothetical protein [Pseudobdellovibrionaceae bacterium]